MLTANFHWLISVQLSRSFISDAILYRAWYDVGFIKSDAKLLRQMTKFFCGKTANRTQCLCLGSLQIASLSKISSLPLSNVLAETMLIPFSNIFHDNVSINVPFLAHSDFNKDRYSSTTKLESQFSSGFFGKITQTVMSVIFCIISVTQHFYQ